jgi:hypothetical protein
MQKNTNAYVCVRERETHTHSLPHSLKHTSNLSAERSENTPDGSVLSWLEFSQSELRGGARESQASHSSASQLKGVCGRVLVRVCECAGVCVAVVFSYCICLLMHEHPIAGDGLHIDKLLFVRNRHLTSSNTLAITLTHTTCSMSINKQMRYIASYVHEALKIFQNTSRTHFVWM